MALKWNDKRYGTGNDVLDAQHKELFDHIEDLLLASETEERKQELEGMVAFLGGYVEQHFRFEEELMERQGCEALEENKADHVLFRERLAALKDRLGTEGTTEPFRETVMELVVHWLEAHIAGVDAKIRNCAGEA